MVHRLVFGFFLLVLFLLLFNQFSYSPSQIAAASGMAPVVMWVGFGPGLASVWDLLLVLHGADWHKDFDEGR